MLSCTHSSSHSYYAPTPCPLGRALQLAVVPTGNILKRSEEKGAGLGVCAGTFAKATMLLCSNFSTVEGSDALLHILSAAVAGTMPKASMQTARGNAHGPVCDALTELPATVSYQHDEVDVSNGCTCAAHWIMIVVVSEALTSCECFDASSFVVQTHSKALTGRTSQLL